MCAWWNLLVFTRSSSCIQLFRDELEKLQQFLFWEFHAYFTAARPRCGGHFVKIFSKIERGKIKDWRFFWSNWVKIEHVLFSSNTQKLLGTCQKLAFTRLIVVWKSGLKNNWTQRLDRVNRPLCGKFYGYHRHQNGPGHMLKPPNESFETSVFFGTSKSTNFNANEFLSSCFAF